jgi:sulfur relay (sulfurtransferase) complex TusBCD TusD component (DsrE family)
VKILVIVNESPWGGSLGLTALRLTRALVASGQCLAAVYFREEGIYHALPGAADAGTPDLRDAWLDLSRDHDVPMLLCSSAVARRLEVPLKGGFRTAGLAEVLELMAACDRLLSF